MKLLALNEVVFDGTGHVYRQGRLMGLINTFVMGGILVGAPFLWRYVGAPWPVWVLCAALALFVVPMLLGDFAAKLRDTNWVLWLRPDGLWINFRSYQDQSSSDETSVVCLDFAEIAQVRKHVEKYTTPNSDGGSTRYAVHSLDIELTRAETEILATALRENRRREQPQRFYLGVGVRSRPSHFPVSLPEADRVRIAWRGGVGNWVAPSLTHVLRELTMYARITEPGKRVRDDWSKLDGSELDDQILTLAQAGSTIDAVNLLVKRRGMTTTEARQFVDELLGVGSI